MGWNASQRPIAGIASGRMALRVLLVALLVTAIGAGSAHAAAGPSVGKRFSCYDTYADSSSASGFSSTFKASLTLHRGGPIGYQVGYSFFNRNSRSDHATWRYAHRTLQFRHGFFGSGAGHLNLVGRYASRGAAMPHSQLTAAKYTVVLRSKGVPANDDAPPRTEGTDFRRASFWYCTTGKPTIRPQGGTSTGTTTAPPGQGNPAPTPAPSGPHPPYATYKCVDKDGFATGSFDLHDPFKYSQPNSVEGSFTYDESTSRIDFHGGNFDSDAIDWHFYGLYSAQTSTIVLASKTQTTDGGPDADENGSHTFWHCTTS
jgi:hypothetical protein